MQLRDAIMSIWTKISEECFQRLVESMLQRIKAVLKAKGSPTRYQQGGPNEVAGECKGHLSKTLTTSDNTVVFKYKSSTCFTFEIHYFITHLWSKANNCPTVGLD